MRRYETIFIVDPEISDENRDLFFDRLRNIILQHDGFLVMFDEWGSRKLAYEIKKRARGYYLRLDYCGTGTLVDEIERFSRIDDRVLKYMSVLLEKDVDLEKIKEETALAEAEKEEPDQDESGQDKPDQGEPDQGELNQEKPDQGELNQEEPDQGELNQEEPDQGALNQEEPDQGKLNQEEPDQIDDSDTHPSADDPPESEEVIDAVTQPESNEEEK